MTVPADRREVAAAWFAAQRRAVMSIEERAAFDAWRDDPQNLAALNAMHELWGEMAAIKDVHSSVLRPLRRRRTPLVAASIGLAAAAVIAVVFVSVYEPFAFAQSERTAVGEQRTETLPDGSVVNLNVVTRLDYTMATDKRRVRMQEGQALFVVHRDKARPFIVEAGDYEVRAVGTAFDVRLRDGKTEIAVQEGTVSVKALRGRHAGEEIATLAVGQKLQLPAAIDVSAKPKPETVAVQSVAEWRLRTVSYEDTSVAEVVADLNRFFPRPVEVKDPALAARRTTLRLQVDDRENTLKTLGALLGARIERGDRAEVLVPS